jgi:hypothetical protein
LHALQLSNVNPGGFFAALLRRKLFHHVTQGQEDAARAKLKALDYAPPPVPAAAASAGRSFVPRISFGPSGRLTIRAA